MSRLSGIRLLAPFLLVATICMCPSLPGFAQESFVLSGQVIDIDGKPVTGTEIFVYDSAVTRRPADFISARTGPDGRYRLILPRRKLWAVARVRGGDKFGPLLPGDRHSGEPLVLEPDETSELKQDFTVVDIREAGRQKQKIRADYLKVTGRVIDQQGLPARDVYIFAHPERLVPGVPEYVSAWTGSNGEYTLHLPPGSYFIGASRLFPAPQGTTGSRELTLKPAHNAIDIDIKLPL